MKPDKTMLMTMVLSLVLTPAALASTWYVNGVSGSDSNNCKSPTAACKTIGHAISLAASGDSISVAAATYTENLTISISLKIIGASAATTIIDGGRVSTVVTISSAGAQVTLSKVTIRNGLAYATNGGGIFNSGTLAISGSIISGNLAFGGGGISNSGTLAISGSIISGNSAFGACFRYCYPGGGGIGNSGALTITQSTISGNSAKTDSGCLVDCIAGGGGISNGGTLAVSNSTITGNSAFTPRCFACFSLGGGIANGNGTLAVSNSTLSDNHAVDGGDINNSENGTAILQNSIVANNTGEDCSGIMTSHGYNLSSDGTCNFNKTGDLNNTDPQLGPLQNNGGPTQTQALLSGSPAIDAGNPSGCTDGSGHLLKTDQRGEPRPDKEDTGGCDMGAFERQGD